MYCAKLLHRSVACRDSSWGRTYWSRAHVVLGLGAVFPPVTLVAPNWLVASLDQAFPVRDLWLMKMRWRRCRVMVPERVWLSLGVSMESGSQVGVCGADRQTACGPAILYEVITPLSKRCTRDEGPFRVRRSMTRRGRQMAAVTSSTLRRGAIHGSGLCCLSLLYHYRTETSWTWGLGVVAEDGLDRSVGHRDPTLVTPLSSLMGWREPEIFVQRRRSLSRGRGTVRWRLIHLPVTGEMCQGGNR